MVLIENNKPHTFEEVLAIQDRQAMTHGYHFQIVELCQSLFKLHHKCQVLQEQLRKHEPNGKLVCSWPEDYRWDSTGESEEADAGPPREPYPS